jgi:hypothetical protein
MNSPRGPFIWWRREIAETARLATPVAERWLLQNDVGKTTTAGIASDTGRW